MAMLFLPALCILQFHLLLLGLAAITAASLAELFALFGHFPGFAG